MKEPQHVGNGNNPWVWSGFGSLIFSADEVRVKGHGLMRATVEHHLMIVDHQRAVDRIFARVISSVSCVANTTCLS